MKKISALVFMAMMMFYSVCTASSAPVDTFDEPVLGSVLINDSITWYQEMTAYDTGELQITLYFANYTDQSLTGSILDAKGDMVLFTETLSLVSGATSLTFYWDLDGAFVNNGDDFIFSIIGDGSEDPLTMLLLTGNVIDGNLYNSKGTGYSSLFDMKYDMNIITYGNPVPLTSSIGFFGFGLISLAIFKRKKEE